MDIQLETRQMLQEVSLLIEQLSNEVYASPVPVLNGQSIGKHIRHILGFYQCLCQCKLPGPLDYSARERDPQVECQPQIAIHKIEGMLPLLDKLSTDFNLQVVPDVSSQNPKPLESTIGREMMYLFDHTVHHLAMINIALKTSFPEITLSEPLGIAYSTRQQMTKLTQ